MASNFTKSDLVVGRILLCVASSGYSNAYTVGGKYAILNRNGCRYSLSSNTSEILVWSHDDFMKSSLVFIMYDSLTDKEKFIYELSGKLPDAI